MTSIITKRRKYFHQAGKAQGMFQNAQSKTFLINIPQTRHPFFSYFYFHQEWCTFVHTIRLPYNLEQFGDHKFSVKFFSHSFWASIFLELPSFFNLRTGVFGKDIAFVGATGRSVRLLATRWRYWWRWKLSFCQTRLFQCIVLLRK